MCKCVSVCLSVTEKEREREIEDECVSVTQMRSPWQCIAIKRNFWEGGVTQRTTLFPYNYFRGIPYITFCTLNKNSDDN